jgi:hypothetical protein
MIDRIDIAGAWPAIVVSKDLFEVVSFDRQAVMIDAHQGSRHHVVAHCAHRFRHCITVAQPAAQGGEDLRLWDGQSNCQMSSRRWLRLSTFAICRHDKTWSVSSVVGG